jgi:hypothetical protein
MAAAFGRFPNIPYTDRNGVFAQTAAIPERRGKGKIKSKPPFED